MSAFIFEGPDGAGKSFTALEFSRAVGLPIHHFGGPPESTDEIYMRAKFIEQSVDTIFDRVPIISDRVYSPIIRGIFSVFSDNDLPRLKDFIIIYCRPSIKTILSVSLEAKAHKSQEHTDKVKKKIIDIINAYDLIMCKIPHLTFNRDKETCKELCLRLQKLL